MTISFRDTALEKECDLRSDKRHGESASLTAKKQLERYHLLLKLAEKDLDFTLNEWDLIYEATVKADFSNAWSIIFLPNRIVEEACAKKLDQKWNVDRQKLIDKLRELSNMELAALLDKIERNRLMYFLLPAKECGGGCGDLISNEKTLCEECDGPF